MGQPETEDALIRQLHESRMATYISAANGNKKVAIELYIWNGRVSGALFETRSITEVIFRNALDDALRRWNDAQGEEYGPDWTRKAAAPLNGLIRKAVSIATQQAHDARGRRPAGHPRIHSDITHDDVVAQLSLGTYSRLLPTQDEQHRDYSRRLILWEEAFSNSFVGRAGEDWRVHSGRVERLLALRNRVAHAEPVLDVNLKGRARDMVRLVQSINPAVAGWLAGTTRIHDTMRTRPRVGDHKQA